MIAMIKRTFDLVAASAGLVALLPVLAVAAVLVRLGSPGPVLFRQARVGLGGEEGIVPPGRAIRARVVAIGDTGGSRTRFPG